MKKLLTLTLAAALALGTLTACGDSSSTSGDSKADCSTSSQESGGSQAELSQDELNELAKTVNHSAHNYTADVISDGDEAPTNDVVFEIGKTDSSDEYIKRMQEELVKEISDKHKGYWAKISFTWSANYSVVDICVNISKSQNSDSLVKYNRTYDDRS